MGFSSEVTTVGDEPQLLGSGAQGDALTVRNKSEDLALGIGGKDQSEVAYAELGLLEAGEDATVDLDGRTDEVWAMAPAGEEIIVHLFWS